MVAVGSVAGVDLERWQEDLAGLMLRIRQRSARREPCWRARDLVLGLLAGLLRVNCWTVAEHAGHAGPEAMGAPARRCGLGCRRRAG